MNKRKNAKRDKQIYDELYDIGWMYWSTNHTGYKTPSPLRGIAKKYGISVQRVRGIAKAEFFRRRESDPEGWVEKDRATIKRLQDLGQNVWVDGVRMAKVGNQYYE